jgi:hypothetical protein
MNFEALDASAKNSNFYFSIFKGGYFEALSVLKR